MSIKRTDLVANKNKNENAQKRILQRPSETQKHFVFPRPGTSLLLSDKSEFPSLSESLGRATNYIFSTGESLTYSDKLKLPSSSRNQGSVPGNIHTRYDTDVTHTHQDVTQVSRSKFQNMNNQNKMGVNSKQNISKQISNHSLNKSMPLNNKKSNVEKKESTNQKSVLKSKLNVQNIAIKSLNHSFDDVNVSSKSSNQSNKSVTVENSESKDDNSATQESAKSKKKKKRKSKIKRQVALQSGKITFLTPEVHSKILNQGSTFNAQNSRRNRVIGNINDEEEYPELGKALPPVSQKENCLKMNISTEGQVESADKPSVSLVKNTISEDSSKDIPVVIVPEKITVEKKEKIHSHNPITISFFDMILEKNVKKKEERELSSKDEIPNVFGLSKLKIKKNSKHPHNLLDSSSPAVKRGKEREKPKPKKPSQLKKIILLDRKARREQLLLMKNCCEEENENVLLSEVHEKENTQELNENEDQSENEDNIPVICEEDEDNYETVFQLNEHTGFCVQDELVSEMMHLNISEDIENYNIVTDLSSDFEEVIESLSCTEKSSSNFSFNEKPISDFLVNEKSKTEKEHNLTSPINNQSGTDAKVHKSVPQSHESLLNSLTDNIRFDISDKEKAVKILLHTRNFREYCNHLISKDIDDVTHALLDDLARFQDRLHQKDPVKARMKKRMIYGVKEVKKHIKLRKLKCIIIAVDIENVETQGGLNDILNEIKVSAVDHHIPCIFALSRKVLGKVCRKPVPVSCVGVFNYEGSEANFKKVVELQSQSKADYTEIFNKLLMKVTDEEVATLIKAKKEAPETLRDVRANILSNFFLPTDSIKREEESMDLNSIEDMPNLIDIPT